MMPDQVCPDDGQDNGEDRGRFEPIQAAWEKIYGNHSGGTVSNCTAWQNWGPTTLTGGPAGPQYL